LSKSAESQQSCFSKPSTSSRRYKRALKIPPPYGLHTDVDDIVEKLRCWAHGTEPYPYPEAYKGRLILWSFLAGLKAIIIRDLGIQRWPVMSLNGGEALLSANYIQWRGHLPRVVLWKNPDSLVNEACTTPTIALVSDIRRSQDLMKYAISPADFSNRMVQFITATRYCVERYGGVFDKFTGDGFIVYFNETICKAAGASYRESFISFLSESSDFSQDHFREWTRNVKKLPAEPIGLALGADLGTVVFQNLNNHLVAVGDPIVWATRLTASANANEILVNNLLYEALLKTGTLIFEDRPAIMKTGESFLAKALLLRKKNSDDSS
jgi:class 3 adenylate cyclase